MLKPPAAIRTFRLAALGLFLSLAIAPACSSDDSLPLVPATRLCEPGLTRKCVGDAACDGGQVCAADGGSWGPCRCGSAGGAGGASTAGGNGGKGGTGGAAGKAGVGGTSQAGGKSGSASGGKGGAAGDTGNSGQGGDEGGDAGAGGEPSAGGGGGALGGDGGSSTAGTGGTEAGGGASTGGSSGQGGANAGGQGGAGVAGGAGKGGGLACAQNRGDCDGDAATGCEVDLKTSAKNCGACGTSCGGQACLGGQCACATGGVAAVPLPADLFLMLDKSSSMDTAVTGGGATKWALSVNGLNAFIDGVQATDRAGMGLGLFPNGSCDAATFAVPTVAVADLPANAGPLKTALAGTAPNGADTPTKPALEGAILLAKKRLADFPGRSPVVVLLTDGEPNECSVGFPTFPPPDVVGQITQIAKAGADAGIQTYVVGVFASGSSTAAKNAVNKWAIAGGTKAPFVLDSSATLATQVTEAFSTIRATAGACAYEVPASVAGAPTKVTVVRETPGNTSPLTRVDGAASCKEGDWYYDDATAPTKLLLCPFACSAMRSTPAAKILVAPSCSP